MSVVQEFLFSFLLIFSQPSWSNFYVHFLCTFKFFAMTLYKGGPAPFGLENYRRVRQSTMISRDIASIQCSSFELFCIIFK